MGHFRYIGGFALASLLLGTGAAAAQSGSPDTGSPGEGLRVFKSANCMGCHKWSGSGGGGYGGAAANLRHTSLTLDQIEQTIRCGRPATGMPHFEGGAYTDGRCYGIKQGELPPEQMPPEPDHPLRPSDIQAVAKYVEKQIKGKGDPTLAQCQAFFGTGTRVCDIYAPDGTRTVQSASAPSGHMKVEAASDANAAHREAGK
jgi:hypothetical protein